MNNLIRFYNQNRKRILIIILFIVFVIGIIQLLNNIEKNKKYSNSNNNTIKNSLNITNTAQESLLSKKSIIDNDKVDEDKLSKSVNIIDEFISYCNNKDINSAYNLLTDECKEIMYPTIEDFNESYYFNVFNNEIKTYTIENWSGNTYQVMITDDILSTGKLESSKTKRDYITIVSNDNETKLNINNFIGRFNINKKSTNRDIEINVLSKDVFMDYETYSFKISNNSNDGILLDDCQNSKSIYLVDNKDIKYYYYNYEIVIDNLQINSKYSKNFKISFGRKYTTSRNIEKIEFTKCILNYDEVLKNNEEKDIVTLDVKI